jgi:GT2 family glycosyltransferase
MVTYNGREYLEDCLRSVLGELGPGHEMVVVDNASTDGTPDFIQRVYPQLRLITNEINRGFAAACNQGAELASGDVLVFLNQDTHVAPGWLRALIAPLAGPSSIGLTTSRLVLMGRPDHIQACGQEVHYTGLVFGRGFGLPSDDINSPATVAAVAGTSFAVRSTLWEELGCFDETFFMYYEETDLSWRAQLAGYRCLYVPDSVIEHDWGAVRPSALRLYCSFRNRCLMLLKNWRWRTLLLLLPALVLAELIEWGLALTCGRRGLLAKVRANSWLLAHVRQIVKLHRRTQAIRTVCDADILEQRSQRVWPQVVTGGFAGRVAVAACNLLFLANHWAAHRVCRWLGW